MRIHTILALSLLPLASLASNKAPPALDCTLAHQQYLLGNATSALNNGVAEISGEAINAAADGENIVANIIDQEKDLHAAFTGSSDGVSLNGFQLGFHLGSYANCKTKLAPKVFRPKRSGGKKLACALNVIISQGTTVTPVANQLPSIRDTFTFGQALTLDAENENYAYKFSLLDINPASGLQVELTDKRANGTVRFIGPAATMKDTINLMLIFGVKEQNRAAQLTCSFI